MDVLLIRPAGSYGRAALSNETVFTQTSLEAIGASSWQREEISRMRLGTVILEDLRFEDLEDDLRVALLRGASGSSCPIVTRWSSLAPDDAR